VARVGGESRTKPLRRRAPSRKSAILRTATWAVIATSNLLIPLGGSLTLALPHTLNRDEKRRWESQRSHYVRNPLQRGGFLSSGAGEPHRNRTYNRLIKSPPPGRPRRSVDGCLYLVEPRDRYVEVRQQLLQFAEVATSVATRFPARQQEPKASSRTGINRGTSASYLVPLPRNVPSVRRREQ